MPTEIAGRQKSNGNPTGTILTLLVGSDGSISVAGQTSGGTVIPLLVDSSGKIMITYA